MITPVPLEKQLVNIDLGKGVDERSRPELMSAITTMENLVCNQTGSWVKRDGTYVGPLEDVSGSSTYPIAVKKIVPFINGWGCIADGGRLLHKQDQTNTFRARQRVMDFNVTDGRVSGSSGLRTSAGAFGPNVKAVAASTTFDAYVINSLPTAYGGGGGDRLCLIERLTGVETVYELGKVSWPGTGGSGREAQMAFVSDRYLHVYVTNLPGSSATDVSLAVIDCGIALPTSEASIVAYNVINQIAGGLALYDVTGGVSRSWSLVYNGTTGSVVSARDVNGNVIDSVTFATDVYSSMDVNEVTGKLWLGTKSAATAKYIALSPTVTSTVVVAAWTSSKPGTFLSCTSDATDVVLTSFQGLPTFGSGNVPTLQVAYFDTGLSVTVVGNNYGWSLASRPFYSAAGNRWYAHMTKAGGTEDLSSNVLVCLYDTLGTPTSSNLTNFTPFFTNNPSLTLPFGSFRVACVLEPMNGYRGTGAYSPGSVTLVPLKYQQISAGADGRNFSVCVPSQSAQRVGSVNFYMLSYVDATAFGRASFSGNTYLSHGGLNSYDGRNLFEQGMVDSPFFNLQVGSAGALNGSYRYVAVYRHVDANGASTYSRVFGPLPVVNIATRNTVVIQPYGVTNRDSGKGDSAPYVELYRTKSGGTQFYLCATQATSALSVNNLQQISADPTTGLLTVSDNLADSALGAMATMYRQPGTPNAAADRYAAPATRIVCQHKDRLFCSDPLGLRVYYSSFFVDGEAAWFNPAFNFFVHAGVGPITALASMDGRLFIFKRDQVFVVDGDGPGEAGPTGNEFSPPQALASRYGCVDHRSVVVTPDGIMYRSTRGIELLTRNLKVQWIGDKVQNTVNANPYTTGVAMGPDARIYWTLASDKNNVNGLYYVPGCTVVYDTTCEAWSIHRLTGYTGILGHAKQSLAFVQEPLGGGAGAMPTEVLVYADGYISVSMQDQVNSNDTAYFTPFTIETGWIKQGLMARQRVSDLLFLAKKRAGGNHAVKLSIAYDYSDTYTQTHTFQPNEVLSTVIEELELQPSKQQVLAIRFKVQDLDPSDLATYPRGNGKGSDVLGIVAEVAPKIGSPKLSAAQKA